MARLVSLIQNRIIMSHTVTTKTMEGTGQHPSRWQPRMFSGIFAIHVSQQTSASENIRIVYRIVHRIVHLQVGLALWETLLSSMTSR